ncbi:MAG: hypothetical protein J1E35_08885 [Lachnospiraceae bacterium]|nr:hypothetical protein [Lachnospiraceae bacterium]
MMEENIQGNDSMQQGEVKKTSNPNEKKSKIISIIIVIAIILSGVYWIWENFMGAKPDVKINGTQISMRNTMQDISDAGFVFCTSTGQVLDPGLDFLNVSGKQIYNIDYYIGIPRNGGGRYCDCSGVQITVANFNSSQKKLKDCSIYEIKYYPSSQDYGVEVLIGGEELTDASVEDWLDFFEKAGYPFKKADMDKVRSGDARSLSEARGAYKFRAEIGSYYSETYMASLAFTRNVKTTYK